MNHVRVKSHAEHIGNGVSNAWLFLKTRLGGFKYV